MGRPPKYSRRYHLTLEPAEANALDTYAREQAKPTATVAARLLIQALHGATSGAGELEAQRRQITELQAANATLRRRLQAREDGGGAERAEPPRWEWTIEDILADRDWWTRWLPRLYVLLGRRLHRYAGDRTDVVDARGYADLLTALFPSVQQNGRTVAEWNSPAYPRYALQMSRTARGVTEIAACSARVAVWEPVIRHVTVALCALELTAAPGADPVLHIKTHEELTGSWLRTLRRITGADAAELPAALI